MPGAGVFQLSAQGMVVQFSGSGAELPALPVTLGDKLQPGAAAATEGIPQQPKLPSSPRFSAKPPSSADRLRSLQPLHIFFQFPSLANSEQLSFRGKNVLQFLQASPALFPFPGKVERDRFLWGQGRDGWDTPVASIWGLHLLPSEWGSALLVHHFLVHQGG